MDPSIICSVKMPWWQVGIYRFSHGHQVIPVRGDGFCFLNTILLVLYCDYSEVVMLNSLAILNPAAYVDYYKWFHTGDILQDAKGYFKFGNYCDSVIDLIIIVTTKVLNVNLTIYQKGPDEKIHVIEQTADTGGRDIHLKFM